MTSRIPSTRSNPEDSQMSRIINQSTIAFNSAPGGEAEDTQAQEYIISADASPPVHFATQQGDDVSIAGDEVSSPKGNFY